MKRVELENVTRIFEPSFVALDGLSLAFERGTIHTILGENGAGKSTLVHILSGMIEPTSGSILIDGEPVRFAASADALARGIAMVHQRPLLGDGLSVFENIILGMQGVLLGRRKRRAEILRLAEDWHLNLNMSVPARSLSPRDRLYTALLAALLRAPSFLILDEPTAILDPDERDRFMETLVGARDRGLGVIVITHKLQDAVRWSDRVSVIRHGRLVFSESSPVAEEKLASFFGDRAELGNTEPGNSASGFGDRAEPAPAPNGVRFSVSGISAVLPNRVPIRDASFSAESGTITGIFGLPGSGIDVLEDLLSGMSPADAGTISISRDGTELKLEGSGISPKKLREAGAGFVPSNRTFRGSNPNLTVRDVIAAGRSGGKQEADRFVRKILESEDIDADETRLAGTLSGGQLQRLILARELARSPRILILAEPEWGLDIARTERFRARLREEARKGMTVIVLTDSPDAMQRRNLYGKVYRLDEGRIR
jgi:simple sugar transport system ATP-binding protein